MMRLIGSSASCGILASTRVNCRPQGSPIHGRQDKSADRGRAHVVGGIRVFRSLSGHSACALPTKTNDFNGPSAIACINGKESRP
jgi:hypothetical protein